MIVETTEDENEDETNEPPAAADHLAGIQPEDVELGDGGGGVELGNDDIVGEEHADEEERFYLNDRVHCIVPPPMVLAEGATSWECINKLGGWDAFLVEFPMLEEIPEQHKGAWASAWSESLRRWRDAGTEQEKQTALLWMSFWSQGLQRKPTRGGKQGRVEVASRYNCVLEGDWAGLVERWERDKLKRVEQLAKKREQRRQMEREEKEQKELDSLRRSVI